MTDDPYVYPGTDVLINKEDIRDADELRLFETEITANRMEHVPRGIPLTYDGYRQIHRYIFEPIYAWAGQERTVNISKGADMFCLVPHIAGQMEKRFATIQAENGLKGLTHEQFVARAAEHICEINAIHPFREGNGRTQRAFLECLAEQAGHHIELQRIDPRAWIDAAIRSFRDGDYEPMRQVIDNAVVERTRSSPKDQSRERDECERER